MAEEPIQVHKRRSLQSSIRADVWDRSEGVCTYCGKALHPMRDFDVDHVIPVSRGGDNSPTNLVASCRRCNLSKQARDSQEFRARLGQREAVPNAYRFLTVEQVAAKLQVHEETVRRSLRDGKLNGHLISRRAGYRIRESEVERFGSGEILESKIAA